MAADKVDLQLLEFVWWNLDIGKFPETGADAVNHFPAGDDFFHHAPRGVDRGLGFGCELDRLMTERDAGDLREGERSTA